MASRIVHRNRTVWQSRDFHPINWRLGLPTVVTGHGKSRTEQPIDCTVAIPAEDPRSPFRAGVAMRDRDEGIIYRIVDYLPPAGGWASTEFWQDRYKIDHRDVVKFVEFGYLDAAIEAGSQIRRYRCRDEVRLRAWSVFKKCRTAASGRRRQQKLSAAKLKARKSK